MLAVSIRFFNSVEYKIMQCNILEHFPPLMSTFRGWCKAAWCNWGEFCDLQDCICL